MNQSEITIHALAMILGEKLKAKHKTISTAESCTAGAIGAAIASVDGASSYYLGGVVAYTIRLKEQLLSVNADTINDYGVVSKETAIEMNVGVRKLTGADMAISITGYAGATGGDGFAENGTIWICVGTNGKEPLATCIHVDGERTENLQRAVIMALETTIQMVV